MPGGAVPYSPPPAFEVPYLLSKPLVYWLDPRRHSDAGAGSAAWTFGTMDTVTAIGGGPAVTLAGTATGAINIRINITANGTLGVATYQLSLDGGVTYPHSGTTSAAEGPYAGITVTFSAGSYTTSHIYSSRVRIAAMTSREMSDGTIGDVNKTASEATATVQHTLLLNGGANYGNQPVIQCTSAGYMRTGTWAASQAQPCTIVVIGQAPANAVRFATAGLASNAPSVSNSAAGVGVTIGASSNVVCTPNVAWASTPQIVIGLFNGATSEIHVAASGPQGTGTVGIGTLTGMTIGATHLLASGWGTSGTGILATVMVFDGILTSGDITTLSAFCLSTWNRGW